MVFVGYPPPFQSRQTIDELSEFRYFACHRTIYPSFFRCGTNLKTSTSTYNNYAGRRPHLYFGMYYTRILQRSLFPRKIHITTYRWWRIVAHLDNITNSLGPLLLLTSFSNKVLPYTAHVPLFFTVRIFLR